MAETYYEKMPNGQYIGAQRFREHGGFDNIAKWISNHDPELYRHNNMMVNNLKPEVANTPIYQISAGVGDSKNQIKNFFQDKTSKLADQYSYKSTGKDTTGLRRIGNIVDHAAKNRGGITAVLGVDEKRNKVYSKALKKNGWLQGTSGEYMYQTNPSQRWILEGLIKRGFLPMIGAIPLPSQIEAFNNMANRFNEVGLSDFDTNKSDIY